MAISRFTNPAGYVGRWVKVRGSNRGFGFCLPGDTKDTAIVEYYDVPGVAGHRISVDLEEIEQHRIPQGSRVWLRGKPYGWHAGEITAWAGWDSYHVKLAGARRDLQLPGDVLTLRWDAPVSDPVAAIAVGLCDSPEYYEVRREFLNELIRQRQVSRGYSAVLSAAVELYPHQLETVARVLGDPVPRYILADEVGLGKTIESGLIMRQMLLDDPETTIVVSTPAPLQEQWRDELADRLILKDEIERGRIQLVVHGQRLTADGRLPSMIVIDEADRLITSDRYRPLLQAQMHAVPGLLLLSATPMRGDSQHLHTLLNLIDPTAFPMEDVAEFRKRLEQREQEANHLQVLTSRRASDRQRFNSLEALVANHPTDRALHLKAERCRVSSDRANPAWREFADHIRETYRISRRMIRHRRDVAAADYPVSGRRKVIIPLVDPARSIVDEFLEDYRERLEGRNEYRAFAHVVLHALGGPRPLMHHLQRRLRAPVGGRRPLDERDRTLLESTVARLQLADSRARTRAALAVLKDRLERGQRVLVIATSHPVAAEFAREASQRWGAQLLGTHLGDQHQDSRDLDVARFIAAKGAALLIGDQTLDEGRNLQTADVLLNLDLPLDPNRLDQRIGRVDRHSHRDTPPDVVAFTEPDSLWVTHHVRYLDEGIGVFDTSVSTVQRAISDSLEELVLHLPHQGWKAFDDETAGLKESLDLERENVDLMEELESITSAADFDEAAVAEFRDMEADMTLMRRAFLQVTSARGGIHLGTTEDKAGLVTFQSRDRDIITGISTDEVHSLRPLLKGSRTFDRSVATSRSAVAPLRWGEPLVDWLDQHFRHDERGRARAVIRPTDTVTTPRLWLNCDFMVEFDDGALSALTGTGVGRLRRRGDALLPPTLTSLWTDAFGEAPVHVVENLLSPPFDPHHDRVLRGPVWEPVMASFPDWKALCRAAGRLARDRLECHPVLTTARREAVHRARTEVDARHSVLRVRASRLPSKAARQGAERELTAEQAVGEALIRGVEKPAVSLIACGAVVLWPSGGAETT